MSSAFLRRLPLLALLALALGVLVACSDDGADVRDVGESTGASAPGSASGSASAPTPSGSAGRSAPAGGLGGYEPVSDVAGHAEVSRDVAGIGALLDAEPVDYAAVGRLYAEGEHSTSGDGTARSLKGFAGEERDEPIWNVYAAFYDDPVWADTFVTQAIEGAGPFAGAADGVRRRAIRTGVQSGVLVAWVLHELIAAERKVAAGELDPAGGAPHEVDGAWALYHGAVPAGAPYGAADERGAEFGTGGAVNAAVLEQMRAAQAAAAVGDAAALRAATDEIVRQITIAHVQAALRHGAEAEAALAEGDEAAARREQAEGLASFRVVAPLVAEVDEPAARRVLEALDPEAGPSKGIRLTVRTAIEATYENLGIRPAEVGADTG